MSRHREQHLNAYLMRRRRILQGGVVAAAALALVADPCRRDLRAL